MVGSSAPNELPIRKTMGEKPQVPKESSNLNRWFNWTILLRIKLYEKPTWILSPGSESHQDYKGQDQTDQQKKHRKPTVFLLGFLWDCWRRARVTGNLLKGVLSNLRTLQKIIENYPSKPIRIPFESSSSNFGGHEPRKPCYTSNHILLVGGFNALEK